ncbi:hypothetical protein RPW65_03695 [Pseudomonas sp. NyZ704]|nr:hypothetical protein RPW65_03695 [Pseudomonas sp. NyZ704]
MALGIALFLIWVVLLLRFPRIMLPISGAVAALALLVAAALGLRHWYTGNLVDHLHTSVAFQPDDCAFGKPLRVLIENRSDRTATQIRWQLTATQPDYNTNLVDIGITDATYQTEQALPPGQQWQGCYRVPPLRSGAHAADLDYRLDRLDADFQD